MNMHISITLTMRLFHILYIDNFNYILQECNFLSRIVMYKKCKLCYKKLKLFQENRIYIMDLCI